MKRQALRALAAAALALTALSAQAQTYPSRPVKVIVPFAAGGPLDIVARGVSDKLSASLKQPFIMENRGGGGGNIGTEAAAKAAPDGYTLLMSLSTTLTANPALYSKLPFDPLKDFRALSSMANSRPMMVVHPSVPVSTLAEFVAYAKRSRSPTLMRAPAAAAIWRWNISRPLRDSRPCRCRTGAMRRW